jgi:hypothetical protein
MAQRFLEEIAGKTGIFSPRHVARSPCGVIGRPLFGSTQRGSPDSSQFMSFSTPSMAVLLSGLSGFSPGNTNPLNLGSAHSMRSHNVAQLARFIPHPQM